mgnify:CR=1 FL=1
MIKAKKSLGQNFLIDENIIKKITNLFNLKNKIILEVGPGTGNLTNSLLKCKAKKVYVIEKDDNLASLLEKKFFNEITVINEDILKVKVDKLNEEKLMVFGNLPYNISTEILCKLAADLDARILPTAVLPVKVNFATRGSPVKTSPIGAGSAAVTRLMTPSGKPASMNTSYVALAHSGVASAGFRTSVHPAANAGPIFLVSMEIG